ncbi:MAG: LysR substrate-binding domain-containing protein [Pseudomonas sp.]
MVIHATISIALATWLISDEIARGELVQVLPTLETHGLPLHLAWPVGRQLLPKVDAVLELLATGLRVG